MRNYGYIQSILDGSEIDYQNVSTDFPSVFAVKYQADVINQGSDGSCVSCAIFEMMHNFTKVRGSSYPLSFDALYKMRKDKSIQGMQPKEALTILKSLSHIKTFAKVSSIQSLKASLVVNGSALIALPVRDSSMGAFWQGGGFEGGHAVAVVGFDEKGFTIKNSWGSSYGYNGRFTLPYDDFGVLYEAWTILN